MANIAACVFPDSNDKSVRVVSALVTRQIIMTLAKNFMRWRELQRYFTFHNEERGFVFGRGGRSAPEGSIHGSRIIKRKNVSFTGNLFETQDVVIVWWL